MIMTGMNFGASVSSSTSWLRKGFLVGFGFGGGGGGGGVVGRLALEGGW